MSFFPKILSSRVRRHANLACIHRKTIHLRARRSYSAFRRPVFSPPRRPVTTAGHTAARYPNSRPAARRSQIGLRRRTRRGASPTSASRSHFTASSFSRASPHIFSTLAARGAPRNTHRRAVFIGKPYISSFTTRRRQRQKGQKLPHGARARRRPCRPDRGVLADLPGGGHRAYPSRAARAGAGMKSAESGETHHDLSLFVAEKGPPARRVVRAPRAQMYGFPVNPR